LIDTLNISYIYNVPQSDLLSNLEKVTTINYPNGNSSFSCNYKDYSISIGEKRIKLTGSIAKQHFGNNFQTIKRPQLIETITDISEYLQIDVSNFKLNRLDVATNYETNHTPSLYFDYLGQDKYGNWIRQPQWNTTVYWNQTKRKKLCYDKSQWAKDKGLKIPNQFIGLNLFRFENRLMSPFVISKVIGKLKPQVKHLYTEDIYKKIIDEWYKQWKNIEKKKKINFNLTNNMTQSEIESLMIAKFIDAIGEDQYSTFFQRLKDNKVFKHPSQYTRFKNAIKEKRRINCVEGNPLIEELEMKIGDVEVYYS
jgi:hypothetical protein